MTARNSIAVAVLVVVLFLEGGQWAQLRQGSPTFVRIIEKRNSTDPQNEGFDSHPKLADSDISGDVAFNAENSGYKGWRTVSHSQGFYTRDLTAVQSKASVDRGWRMSAVTRVEKGGAFVIVDFKGLGRRFDIFTFLDENGDTTVRLITRLLPSFQGPEYHFKGSGVSFHRFDLLYDPKSRQAKLLVDGIPRLTGYSGHTEYAYHSWIAFGPHVYRTPQAITTFQTLRFEIQQ